MNTRELSMGEKQAILKLRKEGAIAQAFGIANSTIEQAGIKQVNQRKEKELMAETL